MQEIMLIVIIAAAFGYAAFSIYRFLRPKKKSSACNPDACGSCPQGGKEGCAEAFKNESHRPGHSRH